MDGMVREDVTRRLRRVVSRAAWPSMLVVVESATITILVGFYVLLTMTGVAETEWNFTARHAVYVYAVPMMRVTIPVFYISSVIAAVCLVARGQIVRQAHAVESRGKWSSDNPYASPG